MVTALGLHTWFASGQQLSDRFLQIESSQTSALSRYKLGFTINTSYLLGSVRVQFCANGPIKDTPCVPPLGFDVSGASIVSQTGETGFSVSAASTANMLLLTRTAATTAPGPVRVELNNVQNPSTLGSFYARLETFSAADGSGSRVDYGGLAMSLSNGLSISTTVPPYLLFCVAVSIPSLDCGAATGSYVNFGEFSATQTRSAQTQFLLATNAANGYSVYVDGPTINSGLHVIPNLTAQDVSRPGTSQFGINLTANTTPVVGAVAQGPGVGAVSAGYATANRFKYVPGDVISRAVTTTDLRRFTVSYIVNIARNQPPGIYVATLTFTGLANF